MIILSYIKLGIAALMPVAAAAILYIINRKTAFSKLNERTKQLIYGVVFGCLAIIGTHWGIPINEAQVNCRDAAVISAGLLFGGPAGVIAGLIGGIERWFSVYLGIGAFTRVACSVSTVIAGIYAALLRKYMFENKKPGWALAFAMGLVMETFHLTMVFITNINTPIEAMAVVRACTTPMLIANSASVLLATMTVEILAKEKIGFKYDKLRISQTIQRWLLVTVAMAFVVTSFFVFRLQTEIAAVQTDHFIDSALDSISLDIKDASERNMLRVTREISERINEHTISEKLKKMSEDYTVNGEHKIEINIINKKGFITASSEDSYIGYDMASAEQSKEFLCLIDESGKESYTQTFTENGKGIEMKYAGIRTAYGFVQVGYDFEMFMDEIDSNVVDITRNRHTGKTGYVLIFNTVRGIVSMPSEDEKGNPFSITGIDKQIREIRALNGDADITEIPTFEMIICGSPCYCRCEKIENYYALAALPKAEAYQMRNIALYVNTFLEILVFAAMFGMIYLLIKRVVVNQISDINSSLAKITNGDLDETVNVRSSTEFASLSDDINSTVSTLKRYIEEASARIDQELTFARDIQRSVLPSVYPAFSDRRDFDIYACMDTAKEVGGDFYDFYLTHKHKLNFLIADVSGKGIPAAMFMMRAKTELKRFTEADLSTGEVFTRSNAALCEGNDAGMFVTAWQAGIDLHTGAVEFANAGHNPPLIRRANGKFEYLRSKPGFILAGMEGMKYKDQVLMLGEGDTIFLYTDGVTEAENKSKELFGEDRLLEAINSREFENMKELCEYIKSEVAVFVGEADQFDDITMVAFRYNGDEDKMI